MAICKDMVKNRAIRFARGDGAQASKAMKLLSDVGGINDMSVTDNDVLFISYNVQQLTLQMLETALKEVGFELNNSLLTQIKRAVLAYCEDAQRSSLGIEQAKADHEALSLSEASAHDPRPDNWRHYV